MAHRPVNWRACRRGIGSSLERPRLHSLDAIFQSSQLRIELAVLATQPFYFGCCLRTGRPELNQIVQPLEMTVKFDQARTYAGNFALKLMQFAVQPLKFSRRRPMCLIDA